MKVVTQVIKRDGVVAQFDNNRIYLAIQKAANAASQTIENIEDLVSKITSKFEGKEQVTVEDIQSAVEHTLLVSKYKETAKKYIEYRHERDLARQAKSKLMRDVEGFLSQSSDEFIKENANKSAGIVPTHRDLLAGIMSKNFAAQILPKDVYEAHSIGAIHVSDLDYLITPSIHNCGVYNFEDMLANGYHLNDAKLDSPKSIGIATTQLSQVFSQISGASYGGQSCHKYDELLRPYAIKSLEKLQIEAKEYNLPEEWVWKKLRKEIYDAHQTFIYQISTISGPNGQSSFSTISLSMSDDPICRMIKEEYLKCHMAGLGKDGRTSIFPKVIYFLEEGINLNEGDPLYEEFQLALECTAKRFYPNYIMAPNNRKMTGAPDVITNMGCRSFVSNYIEAGKTKYTARFNAGVTTVSIPFAALLAKGDKTKFYEELDKLCELAYKANMFRVERFKKTKAKQNPILWMEGALARLDPEDCIEPLLYDGNATLSLSYIGIAEAQNICNDYSKQFAQDILIFLGKKSEEFTKRSRIGWKNYGMPAENSAYSFMTKLKKAFPDYKSEHLYLTNSYHKSVWEKLDIFEKFDLESDFYMLSQGGNVNNIELPNMIKNIKGLESVVKAAYDKVQYLIVNTPIDRCFECGFEGEFSVSLDDGYRCPKCGNNNPKTASVVRVVSGYIFDPLSRPANDGKTQEITERYKHL